MLDNVVSPTLQLKPSPACARVPPDAVLRECLRTLATAYVAERRLVPPLALEELRAHAVVLATATPGAENYADFLLILLSNALWREAVAAVPFTRRLLLLPQCLRDRDTCRAQIDEFGLLCEGCGGCDIGRLQDEAEKLGYVVLVAEGTTVAARLLEQGKVEAVVGAGCMESLERIFPFTAADAIPGLAVPLLHNGCNRTAMDTGWLLELLHLAPAPGTASRLDMQALRAGVDAWFTPAALDAACAGPDSAVRRLALDWLAKAGKRWRPFLTAGVYAALAKPAASDLPEAVRDAALAAECFHKASLIHDDIEDDDATRYAAPALHLEHGVAQALNTGDWLIGEGYRLLANLQAPAEARLRLLVVAAEAHRRLCEGQGAELAWVRHPGPLTAAQVLDIFRGKTAPAFEVALRFGAILAGAEAEHHDLLGRYSEALGIAYQIHDDLADSATGSGTTPVVARGAGLQPSILLAVAWEAGGGQGAVLCPPDSAAEQRVRALLAQYRQGAVEALAPLRNAALKSLLARVLSRVLPVPPRPETPTEPVAG